MKSLLVGLLLVIGTGCVAAKPSAEEDAGSVEPTTTVSAVAQTTREPSGESTTTTTAGVNEMSVTLPAIFAAAAELNAVPEVPHVLLAFDAGIVAVTLDGEVLGRRDLVNRRTLGGYPDEDPGPWSGPIPDDCVLDSIVVNDQESRFLCTPLDRTISPSIEIVSLTGDRVVVGALPPPPQQLVDAQYFARFLAVYPAPESRNLALLQMGLECETRQAMFLRTGEITGLDGTSFWSNGQSGESEALGWLPDGRALVRVFSGPCSTEQTPGLYAFVPNGESELLTDLPEQVQWAKYVPKPPQP